MMRGLLATFWVMTGIVVGIFLPMDCFCNGFKTVELTGDLDGATLQYQINEADPRANGQDTISISLEVPEVAWLGFGFSTTGAMVGSESVVGIPSPRGEEGLVSKFQMRLYSFAGFQPLPRQTLINPTMTQTNTSTTLQFTKILIEENEVPIMKNANNTFLTAWGSSNEFGYHAKRSAYTLLLGMESDSTTPSPVGTPSNVTDAPTSAPTSNTTAPTSAPTMPDVNGTTSSPTPPTRLRRLA